TSTGTWAAGDDVCRARGTCLVLDGDREAWVVPLSETGLPAVSRSIGSLRRAAARSAARLLQQSSQPLDLRGEGVRPPSLLLGIPPLCLDPFLAGWHRGAGGSLEQPQREALRSQQKAQLLAP